MNFKSNEMKILLKKDVEVDVKTLSVSAGVRYWEDSDVNDVEDTEGDLIPCRLNDAWCPLIDIETGQIINWEIGKTADVHYKVCDDGDYRLLDENKEEVFKKIGYVPDCLAIEDKGYGDYIILKIDENGFINNWQFKPHDVRKDFMEDED